MHTFLPSFLGLGEVQCPGTGAKMMFKTQAFFKTVKSCLSCVGRVKVIDAGITKEKCRVHICKEFIPRGIRKLSLEILVDLGSGLNVCILLID